MPDVINAFNLDDNEQKIISSHELVKNTFDWKVIAVPYVKKLEETIS